MPLSKDQAADFGIAYHSAREGVTSQTYREDADLKIEIDHLGYIIVTLVSDRARDQLNLWLLEYAKYDDRGSNSSMERMEKDGKQVRVLVITFPGRD